jgi:DNA-binding protein HU-beta
MNKAELTKSLAGRMSVTQSQAQKFLDTFQEILGEELKQDNNLSLLGFGVFSPWKQTERIGRNPRTGVECVIRPRLSVKFKPAARFLEILNDEQKTKKGKTKNKK